MLDPQGRWLPTLSPRGLEFFDARERYLLAWGPRKTGKTLAILHKLVRHAFQSPPTTIAIVARTLKVGRIGPWSDLMRITIPEWVRARIGFVVTKEESFMADTKMCYIRVSNYAGEETQIELHSCESPEDAEAKFKSGRWSFIFMSEADTFPDPKPFDVLSDQLRNPLMRFEDQQFVLDANPAKEGQNHWLHHRFFRHEERRLRNPKYAALFRELRFGFEHNPFIGEAEVEELKAKYELDPPLYARFVAGEWIADRSTCLFGDVFSEQRHVLGGPDPDTPNEVLDLVPVKGVSHLIGGWDIGDRNHAFAIVSPRIGDVGLPTFDTIDELICLGRDLALADFVDGAIEKMDAWEGFIRREYGAARVQWHHWSDSSAFKYRSALDAEEAIAVREHSEGRILMHTTIKGPGSVRKRVAFMRKLLSEGRLFFSAKCTRIIDSITSLRRGTTQAEFIDSEDPLKHAFDALSYALANEIRSELSPHAALKRRRRGGMVFVGRG